MEVVSEDDDRIEEGVSPVLVLLRRLVGTPIDDCDRVLATDVCGISVAVVPLMAVAADELLSVALVRVEEDGVSDGEPRDVEAVDCSVIRVPLVKVMAVGSMGTRLVLGRV